VRKGTLIAVIVLFVLLAGAATYQLTLGHHPQRYCGPASPGAQPTNSSCVAPSSSHT
jgi:hypothetical protein